MEAGRLETEAWVEECPRQKRNSTWDLMASLLAKPKLVRLSVFSVMWLEVCALPVDGDLPWSLVSSGWRLSSRCNHRSAE